MGKRFCLLTLTTLTILISSFTDPVFATVNNFNNSKVLSTVTEKNETPFYASIFSTYKDSWFIKEKTLPIRINPSDFIKNDQTTPKEIKNEMTGNVSGLLLDYKTPGIQWQFRVEKSGLYLIDMMYLQQKGSYLPITRKLKIDGAVLFDELNRVSFPRLYKDDSAPITNQVGDEVRPAPVEIEKLTEYALMDNQGKYSEPFFFYLDAGIHSLSMDYIDQPMILLNISLQAAEKQKTYKEYLQSMPDVGEANYGTDSIYLEAENYKNIEYKTDSSISIGSDSDPKTSPRSVTNTKMNIIGSYTWRKGNQSIRWNFNIKNAGYYKISMRVKQAYNNGLYSCRQIKIDGAVPFRELSEYYFPFSRDFYTHTLKNREGDAFLFYLEPGNHSIDMTVKMGGFTEIYHDTNRAVIQMNTIIRRITMITGNDPDVNYDYRLDETIPDLLEQLNQVKTLISGDMKKINSLSDGKSTIYNQMLLIENQLSEMIKNPKLISRRLSELTQAVMILGDCMSTMTEQPFAIDYIEVLSPETAPQVRQSNFYDKLIGMIQSFAISFTKDYDAIGSTAGGSKPQKILNVWMSRGKEWGELLKEIADAEYTPESGTAIKIKILPAGTLTSSANPLLLSINSGKAPDVALSLPSNLPVEYAIRDAVVKLNEMPGYEKVSKQFIDAVSVPFMYGSGVYAIPETINMRVLFYRKDIFDELGLSVPDTWDEVYNELFPALYKNKMEMYIPPFYDMFLAQYGGKYYTQDGFHSALDEKPAFMAFEQLVKLYTNYGVPFSANFFNRMRSGEMPVGIDGYAFYTQIAYAAPELNGKWDIAPIPGTVMEDGSINRKTGGIVSEADVILSQSSQKNEAWDFLSWWTSTKTQIDYGNQLEARIGSTAKWNSSNVEAFRGMSWPREHLEVIENNWENAVEQKIVLGGYFTGRHLSNALNRCVVSSQPPRDSLEEAVEQINIELKRKQESKGIFVDQSSETEGKS